MAHNLFIPSHIAHIAVKGGKVSKVNDFHPIFSCSNSQSKIHSFCRLNFAQLYKLASKLCRLALRFDVKKVTFSNQIMHMKARKACSMCIKSNEKNKNVAFSSDMTIMNCHS